MVKSKLDTSNPQNNQVRSTPVRDIGIKKYTMAYKTPTVRESLNNSGQLALPVNLRNSQEYGEDLTTLANRNTGIGEPPRNSEEYGANNGDKGDNSDMGDKSDKKRKSNILDKVPNTAVPKDGDSRERACKMAVSVKGVPITDMKSYLARKKMEREKKLRNEAPISGAASSRGKLKN